MSNGLGGRQQKSGGATRRRGDVSDKSSPRRTEWRLARGGPWTAGVSPWLRGEEKGYHSYAACIIGKATRPRRTEHNSRFPAPGPREARRRAPSAQLARGPPRGHGQPPPARDVPWRRTAGVCLFHRTAVTLACRTGSAPFAVDFEMPASVLARTSPGTGSGGRARPSLEMTRIFGVRGVRQDSAPGKEA